MKTEKEINKNVNGYYVPKLEDFKPGFKFETALYRKGDLNYKENIAEEDKWIEKEVVWIKQPDGSYTSPGVIGIRLMNICTQLCNIQELLNNCKIRVKTT